MMDEIVDSTGEVFNTRFNLRDMRKVESWVKDRMENIDDMEFYGDDTVGNYLKGQEEKAEGHSAKVNLQTILSDNDFFDRVRENSKILNSKESSYGKKKDLWWQRLGFSKNPRFEDMTEGKRDLAKLVGYMIYGLGIPAKSLTTVIFQTGYSDSNVIFKNLIHLYGKLDEFNQILEEYGLAKNKFKNDSYLSKDEIDEIVVDELSEELDERFNLLSNNEDTLDRDFVLSLASATQKEGSKKRKTLPGGVKRHSYMNYMADAGLDGDQARAYFLMRLNNILKAVEIGAVDKSFFYNSMNIDHSVNRDTLADVLGNFEDHKAVINNDVGELNKWFLNSKRTIQKGMSGNEEREELQNLHNEYQQRLKSLLNSNEFEMGDRLDKFYESTRAINEIDKRAEKKNWQNYG